MQKLLIIISLFFSAQFVAAGEVSCPLVLKSNPISALSPELQVSIKEIRDLQLQIQTSDNPILRSMLVKNRDRLISQFKNRHPEFKLDLSLLEDSANGSKEAGNNPGKNNIAKRELHIENFDNQIQNLHFLKNQNFLAIEVNSQETYLHNLTTNQREKYQGRIVTSDQDTFVVEIPANQEIEIRRLNDFSLISKIKGKVHGRTNPLDTLIPIATGSSFSIVDFKNGTTQFEYRGPNFSPNTRLNIFDNNIVLLNSAGVEVLDLRTKTSTLSLYGFSEISKDGRSLIVNENENLVLYDIATARPLHKSNARAFHSKFAGDYLVYSSSLDATGTLTFVSLIDGTVVAKDLKRTEPKYLPSLNKFLFSQFEFGQASKYFLYDPVSKTEVALPNFLNVLSVDPKSSLVATVEGRADINQYTLNIVDLSTLTKLSSFEIPNIQTINFSFTEVTGLGVLEFEYRKSFLIELETGNKLLEVQFMNNSRYVQMNSEILLTRIGEDSLALIQAPPSLLKKNN